jgi:Tfp pilus assembly protein FimT
MSIIFNIQYSILRPIRGKDAGFTLMELAVGMSVFMLLLMAVTGMMMSAFKSDSQSRAYEEVQSANIMVVNDLMQEARFSTKGEVKPNYSQVGGTDYDALVITNVHEVNDPTDDEVITYLVNNNKRIEKLVNGVSQGEMISKKIYVEQFTLENKAISSDDVELLLLKFKLVDNPGEMREAEGKQFLLSIRR